jgi:hypothetical protein
MCNNKVYFDVSDLMQYCQHNTTLSGIQRVAVMSIARIIKIHGTGSIDLIGYHPIKRRAVVFSSKHFE